MMPPLLRTRLLVARCRAAGETPTPEKSFVQQGAEEGEEGIFEF